MAQINITIEAINPVNKSNIETIISKISKMEGVSFAHLVLDDQYKFKFMFGYDDSIDTEGLISQIKSLLGLYYSTILSLKYNSSETGI